MRMSDIEEAVRESEREGRRRRGKYRFGAVKDAEGHIIAVRALQGHNNQAIKPATRVERIEPPTRTTKNSWTTV